MKYRKWFGILLVGVLIVLVGGTQLGSDDASKKDFIGSPEFANQLIPAVKIPKVVSFCGEPVSIRTSRHPGKI